MLPSSAALASSSYFDADDVETEEDGGISVFFTFVVAFDFVPTIVQSLCTKLQYSEVSTLFSELAGGLRSYRLRLILWYKYVQNRTSSAIDIDTVYGKWKQQSAQSRLGEMMGDYFCAQTKNNTMMQKAS